MPRGDGTGPTGQGPGTGRRGGRGRGRRNTNAGIGPAGYCVCPNCGNKVPHTTGIPCSTKKCPECGKIMARG